MLLLLVENQGQIVTREKIRQRLWGDDVFVELDDSLNHAVRKLREALGDSAEAPRFVKTLPRRGYQFLVPVQAEYHQSGNGATAIEGPARKRHGRRRRLLIGAGVASWLASGLLVVGLWRRQPPAMPASLLVLPFRSLDADPRNGRLGEGISEQITAKLMNLEGLSLVSPEAAYRVSSLNVSPAEAGRRLNTEAVLNGSVRTAGRKFRANVQLIRSADGQILWADGGVEIEARDLLEAESLLATTIATRLRGALTARERNAIARMPTLNAEAYELFVRGKIAMRDRERPESLRTAAEFFERAVRLDPGFAEGLAWLAMAQATIFKIGDAGDEIRRASIENARKAIAVDPSVVTARRALITIFHSTGQAEEGLKEAAILRKAGATDAVSLSAIANAYLRAGMPDRAVLFYQQSLELDPEEPTTPDRLAFSAYWAGQYELGLRALEGTAPDSALLPRMNLAIATGRREMARATALQIMQNRTTGSLNVAFAALALIKLGEGQLARRILRERLPADEARIVKLRNERPQIGVGLAYSILGERRRALEQVRIAFDTNPGDPWVLYWAAEIHAQFGDERQAISNLREAFKLGFLSLPYLDWPEGKLYHLRDHPEVRALREDVGSKIAAFREQY